MTPSEVAFDQLERADASAIVRFLKEAGLVTREAAKAADDLGQLRNRYAHARGKDPQPDALKAINLLHIAAEPRNTPESCLEEVIRSCPPH